MGEPVCYLHMLDEEGRMPDPMVRLRRVYDPPPAGGDATQAVLVDRVWPRGVRKEDLEGVRWLRELAPSDELRRWFGHRPERWDEFRRRFRQELAGPDRLPLLEDLAAEARKAPLTLLYGARDRTHNQAVVIAEALEPLLT